MCVPMVRNVPFKCCEVYCLKLKLNFSHLENMIVYFLPMNSKSIEIDGKIKQLKKQSHHSPF